MDIVSFCPFETGSLVWRPRPSDWALTVVCKGTFDLLPGEARLSADQDLINDDDSHWNDDVARSLSVPTDLVPFKARSDVLLVGYAYAPQGRPARSVVVRMVVGDVDKSMEVFVDRWWSQDGLLVEGAPFAKMALRYERSAGGPSTWNPVGVRADATRDAYGKQAVPNLQPAGLLLTDPSDHIEPIGFGPIASTWPLRRDRVHEANWSLSQLAQAPLPGGVDPSFFNAAPPDQQVAAIRDNERIVLEHLHPEHGRLVTNLPGLHPRAFVEWLSGPEPVPLSCDTLLIDTNRSVCTLVWRGRIPIEGPNQLGRIVVGLEAAGQQLTHAEILRSGKRRPANRPRPTFIDEGTIDGSENEGSTAIRDAIKEPPNLPPNTPAASPKAEETKPPNEAKPAGRRRRQNAGTMAINQSDLPPASAAPAASQSAASGLPFVATASQPPPAERRSEAKTTGLPFTPGANNIGVRPLDSEDRTDVGKMVGDAAPAWLKRDETPPVTTRAGSGPTGVATVPQPASAAPPAAIATPAPPPPVATPATPPPSAVSAAPLAAATGSSPGAAGAPNSPWAAVGASPASAKKELPAVPAMVRPVASGADGSAASISNAAAAASGPWTTPRGDAPPTGPAKAASPVPRVRRPASSEVIELLWYDEQYVQDVRAKPEWADILEEIRPEPQDVGFDEEPPPETPPEELARRDVFAVLTRAEPVDGEGVAESIGLAVQDDGTFEPPLVVVSGELYFPFDELETLKATLTAVTPLVAGDKALQEVVDTVTELLKTPWLQSSSNLAEGQTQRIRDAFSASGRMVSNSYLEQHTERVLLEQRAFQKRTVFGAGFIRALFSPFGAAAQIPSYLPEDLATTLPMFQRLKVRCIGAANGQQDQYESHPTALRVVALGRVLPVTRR